MDKHSSYRQTESLRDATDTKFQPSHSMTKCLPTTTNSSRTTEMEKAFHRKPMRKWTCSKWFLVAKCILDIKRNVKWIFDRVLQQTKLAVRAHGSSAIAKYGHVVQWFA